MCRIVLGILFVAATGCSDALGLKDVTRDDGTDPARIAALEDQVTALQTALQPVSFHASLGTPQTVDSSVATIVAFTEIQIDTHNAFDAAKHQYVVPVAGQYLVTAIVGITGINKGRVNCELWIDPAGGSAAVAQAEVTTPANASGIGAALLRVPCTTLVQAGAGDGVYVRTFQDSGATLTLEATPVETNLQIVRIPSVE